MAVGKHDFDRPLTAEEMTSVGELEGFVDDKLREEEGHYQCIRLPYYPNRHIKEELTSRYIAVGWEVSFQGDYMFLR